MHVVGELQRIRNRVERNLGNRRLSQRCRQKSESSQKLHLCTIPEPAGFMRWNEKAGLRAGCDKLPMDSNALEVQRRPAMKKNITGKRSPRRKLNPTTIGMDLGDKTSHYCVLERDGQVGSTGTVPTTKKGMLRTFGRWKRCRLAMEVDRKSVV